MSNVLLPVKRTKRLPLLPRDQALIALFAALIAVLGLFGAIPLGPVAITLQTLGVMLAGSVLGARRAFLCVLTFLVLVFAGLPLLAGGRGGLGLLFSPSAGFLFGWLLGALVVGWLAPKQEGRFLFLRFLFANLFGGVVVIYAIGVPVAAWRLDSGLIAGIATAIQFVPGDLIKAILASLIAKSLLLTYPIAPAGLRQGSAT